MPGLRACSAFTLFCTAFCTRFGCPTLTSCAFMWARRPRLLRPGGRDTSGLVATDREVKDVSLPGRQRGSIELFGSRVHKLQESNLPGNACKATQWPATPLHISFDQGSSSQSALKVTWSGCTTHNSTSCSLQQLAGQITVILAARMSLMPYGAMILETCLHAPHCALSAL